jgi:predicted ArsR family transcriptional regulator
MSTMQATRFAILGILKRQPNGGTVESLAKALRLATMTVRQHLTILERDGYVTFRQVRRPLGRPHHVYTITAAAEEVFPKNYELLTQRILTELRHLEPEEIQGLAGDAKVSLLFQKMADRVAGAQALPLHTRPMQERIEAVTALLNDEGAISEWASDGEKFEIRSYNCPYQKVAENNYQLCVWHRQLLERLIGAPISLERCLMQGETMDTYVVRTTVAEARTYPLADVEIS